MKVMLSEAKSAGRLVLGSVSSASRDKTITVVVERKVMHTKYRKYIKRTTKLHAHDEANQCKQGDKVLIQECRPLSKTKTWKLVEIVESTPGSI